MNHQAEAILYDGKSSVPQNITIFLNKYKHSFTFETATVYKNEWFIKEVVFETLDTGLQMQHQGDDAIEIIKIADAAFINHIKLFRKENGHENWYEHLINLGIKMHMVLALLIFALIGLTYVYVIPWFGEKSVAIIPESYDDKLGSSFVEQSLLFSEVDEAKTKSLNAFAKELQLNNTKPLNFVYVNEDVVNAFALPNGTIVVYSGIVDKMQNYDELVALLGHESAHVTGRHSMKMLCRNLSGYIFISAILGDANGVMAIIGDNVNSLQSLSFSRKFEEEADLKGLQIVTKNKVDPKGMSNLFKRLQSKGTMSIPQFLSSHPITEERIKYINALNSGEKHDIQENVKLKKLFHDMKQ
ncbi:Zn-dependent protease with chaperone function [Flavobacterium sp. 7E]|uniref:M48 family metallopeptidase n=1 Tax=Flavobacterium sp. 7E TaxID=2735898 RepID=UPI001570596E|nr:M48 family metallopeptidase [Flavobacterium sp. 7E]NRS88742.1 Zn-dependent protease with chaperone function [Flavobacterium sp. 7E]